MNAAYQQPHMLIEHLSTPDPKYVQVEGMPLKA